MKKLVAKTDYYSIEVDLIKNRMYLVLVGYWKNLSVVSHYLDDIQKALHEVSHGFTVLTNASDMRTPPADIAPLHEKAQQLLVQGGIKKTAELIPKEMAIEKMVLQRWSAKSGMLKRSFNEQAAAEAWLDVEK